MNVIQTVSTFPEVAAAVSHARTVSDPIAVFLYGSHARGDATERSDFEFAAVYEDGHRASRAELAIDKDRFPDLRRFTLYPFKRSALKTGLIETPFPKALYLNELHDTAVGVFGESPQTLISAPDIKVVDLRDDCYLTNGRLLAGLDASRNGDTITVSQQLVKAYYSTIRVGHLLATGNLIHRKHELDEKAGTVLGSDLSHTGSLALPTAKRMTPTAQQKYIYDLIAVVTKQLLPKVESMELSTILHKKKRDGSVASLPNVDSDASTNDKHITE